MNHPNTMILSAQHTRLDRKSVPSKRFRSVTFPPAPSPITDLLLLPPSLTIPSWTLRPQDFGTHQGHPEQIQLASGYPSPPSADPHFESHIFLPALYSFESDPPPIRTVSFGGILDSPPVMCHEALKRSAPPSPPPTLPISTSSLPRADSDSFQISPLGDTPDMGYDSDSESPLLETFTPSSESSCSTLLSPISPTSPDPLDWQQHYFPSPTVHSVSSLDSALLHSNVDTSPTSPVDHDGSSLHERHLHTQEPMSSKRPLLSPLSIPNPYNLFWPVCHSPKELNQPSDLEPIDLESAGFPFSPYPDSPEIDTLPEQDQGQEQSYEPTGNNDAHAGQWEPQQDEQLHAPTHRQGGFPHPSSPSIRNNSLPEFDDDPYYMEIDIPEVPPESPSLRSYTALPDDDNHPCDDSQPSCPSLEEDTVVVDTLMLSPPASPGPALLTLPGAEADDDLIPLDLASTNPSERDYLHSSPLYPNTLLIIGDDSPTHSNQSQRSPSPEPCAVLDMNVVMDGFPEDDEIRRICGLLKRTKDAERAARQMEAIVEEEERVNESIMGSSGGTGTLDTWSRVMDARRKTRRRREKVREVATLLRLQLAQRGWKVGKDGSGKTGLMPISPPVPVLAPLEEGVNDDEMKLDLHHRAKGQPKKQQRITSPQQLLVKMIMDRHEPRHGSRVVGPGSLIGRKTMSPLAKGSFSANEVETGVHAADGIMQENTPQMIFGIDMDDDLGSGKQDMDDLDLELDLGPLPSP